MTVTGGFARPVALSESTEAAQVWARRSDTSAPVK